jgi:pimeloyl-ACP methyl ester carboxylesterase
VWLRDVVLPLFVTAALLAAGLCLLVYLAQERLIFYPQPLAEGTARVLERAVPRSQALELVAGDGTRLRGWLVRGQSPAPWPLVLYFGGNAEEVSWLLPEFSRLPDWATLLVNYRGYGLSEGRPSEAALYRDALALYDSIVERADIDPRRVVVVGRSLGTGIATYVASQRPVAGVVLVSPFDSMVEVARGMYPFLPVDLLLRHRFESDQRARLIRAPLLALVAAQDTLVRPERSRRLLEVWGGVTRLELLDGVDHNTIHTHPRYWPLLAGFLSERRSGTGPPAGR